MKMMGRGGMMGMGGMAQDGASFKVGDAVRVKSGASHDMDDMEQVGIIVEIGSPALAIKFPDDEVPHKWYVAEELELAEENGEADEEGMRQQMQQRVAKALMGKRQG